MTDEPVWQAEIEVVRRDAPSAQRLYRTLRPESEREVPRVRAILNDPVGPVVKLAIEARDTGAVRAALNTFLGWVDLAIAAEAVAA